MLNITTAAVEAAIITQLEAAFNQAIPLFPKAFNRVLAKVLSGVVVLLYKYCGWVSLQMFVKYASFTTSTLQGRSFRPLAEWGKLIGVGEPIAAQPAELTVAVSVLATGDTLAAGSQLLQAQSGVLYITKTSVNLDAASVSVNIMAVGDQEGGSGSGVIGNLDNGNEITFVNPIASIDPVAVVSGTLVTGVEGETESAYRKRVEDRFKKRPQGGAYADYAAWGGEVPGVAAVYPYTSSAPGAVDVYVEAEDQADGYPTAAQLAAVDYALRYDSEGRPYRRPANALINVQSIYRAPFTVAVHGLSTTSAEGDIAAAISEHIYGREPYIEGLSVLPRLDLISVAALSGLAQSIAALAGGYITGVTLSYTGGAEMDVYTLQNGEKAKCTEVTFD